jgi:transposase
MEDNAPPHKAKSTTDYYMQYPGYAYFYRIKWPASSPDLNPIENVWQLLKARIRARPTYPTTLAEMEAAVIEEWEHLEVEDFAGFINSMPERIEAVIAAGGGHTRW